MTVVVLLVILAVIAFLLVRSIQDARRHAAQPDSDSGSERTPPTRRTAARPRPRRGAKPALEGQALATHVTKLREAVDGGLISVDEAVESIVRQTDGALGEDAARRLLQGEDSAA